jgi:hypothetical protein
MLTWVAAARNKMQRFCGLRKRQWRADVSNVFVVPSNGGTSSGNIGQEFNVGRKGMARQQVRWQPIKKAGRFLIDRPHPFGIELAV